MDFEKLKKHVHPDANKNLSSAQKLVWFICVLIPFFIFTIFSGFSLLIFFASDDNKSYNISNLGFAILIGLSSVCFSYYKLLENSNYVRLHKDVQRSGEFFLISAIAFIISSALKYSWTLHIDSYAFIRAGLKASLAISFFVAEIVCIRGFAKLIDVLHIRITNPI